jgi:hypothetical protein
MRLDEIAQQPALDKQTILAELAKLNIKFRSTINVDGSVDVQGEVVIPYGYTKIPVQFRTVSGHFKNCAQIESLKGAPSYVGGTFWCDGTPIRSLWGSPTYVGGSFYCHNTQIKSLRSIHKTHADWVIDGKLLLPETCTHLLGLAHIPGVKRVQLGPDENAIDIIHDVFEWQEKLLDLGLVEQAQI